MIGAHHGADACVAASCIADARLDFLAFDPLRTALTVDLPARQGLHIAHRLVAVALAVLVIGLAWRMARSTQQPLRGASHGTARPLRTPVGAILVLLVLTGLEALIGSAFVRDVTGLSPLAGATMHSGFAALLAGALAAAGVTSLGACPKDDVALPSCRGAAELRAASATPEGTAGRSSG